MLVYSATNENILGMSRYWRSAETTNLGLDVSAIVGFLVI